MSSPLTSSKKLTDHKVLIFDVYGTLADWESGIFTALHPLLTRYPVSKNWTRAEALSAFMSVEGDLQAQFPDMLYNELLAKVHEIMEERIKALSGADNAGAATSAQASLATTDPAAASTTDAGASTSAAGAKGTEENEHTKFGNSIQHWPVFPDTCDALQRLAKHFKLVVLSNVDRQSFRYTHRLLSEGPSAASIAAADLATYTYPEPNPNKYWHPQTAPHSKSPFTVIMTAQDTGCFKPALGGFLAALDYFGAHPEVFGDLELGLGAEEVKDRVMSVAQSLPHDHEAASRLGMRSVWIDRQSAVTCNVTPGGPGAKDKWTWRFETLGEMADAVEKELQEKV
ncbi:HAD-like protein [Pholiota conissans]|uniref:HAD-like protein n=1 Tax=Pholiota conissans TaxID=109636 RepID=A0A9P6CR25_9AGAR|nr:HAD-like protein [Pholiota conissans]